MVGKTHRDTGIGPEWFTEQRRAMVDEQIRARGIVDERVLKAMAEVPREEFVSEHERSRAYHDNPLPIGFGQTISQPFTVAFQAAALQLKGAERVLEIGTGSGYGAAVLSKLATEVFTIECIPELADHARSRLERLGYSNVHVFAGDGTLGLPEHAPYGGIVVTAGAAEVPKPYVEQLAPGGRLVIPVGSTLYGQEMCRFTRLDGSLRREALGEFAFVPLVGRYGWDETFR